MSLAPSAPLRRIGTATGKPGFAKRAAAFANRAPGFPFLWIAGAAAAGIMTVTGGFGTVDLPAGQRLAFWLVLMGWNTLKWQLWFAALVRKPTDWMRSSLIGVLLLNLSLPLEISLAARLVGISGVEPAPLETWARALGIGAVIFVTGLVVARALGFRTFSRPAPAVPVSIGILERARIVPDALAAIEAEDHYCRVRRSDGSNTLVHYRFGDALGEVGGLEGAQVHRGAWVASSAVSGAVREGGAGA